MKQHTPMSMALTILAFVAILALLIWGMGWWPNIARTLGLNW